jgi:hypothetical protein
MAMVVVVVVAARDLRERAWAAKGLAIGALAGVTQGSRKVEERHVEGPSLSFSDSPTRPAPRAPSTLDVLRAGVVNDYDYVV